MKDGLEEHLQILRQLEEERRRANEEEEKKKQERIRAKYLIQKQMKDRELLKHHGKVHPKLAAENAYRDFGVSPIIQNTIKSHMWPLNFKDFPKSKEARILTWADKAICIREALTSIRHKKKNRNRYLAYIDKLFDK